MRWFFRLLFILAAGLVPAAALAKPPLLILISIDGFGFDYLGRGKTPVLAALAAAGVSGPMRPSYPSLTFPNHYTLVTGLRPDHHGIVDNTMEDGKLGRFTMENSNDPRWWNAGEPLWVTADKQGIKTAALFWPGSDKVIRGYRPDLWKAYDKTFLADDRVRQVLTWLDLPPGERPGFVTLYFDLVDTQGHHFGPYSQELDEALASTDAALGRLVDGLKARGLYAGANLIVVADHGMALTDRSRIVYLDDLAGDAKAVHLVNPGTSVGLSLTSAAPKGMLAKLLGRHPHISCWKKADVPKALHYGANPRVPPIVCLAEVGWYISTHDRIDKQKDFNVGNHGYDPADPQMAAVFVAEGPAFQAGRVLPPFDNIDIQPLAARLLRLKAPKADGTAKIFQGVLSAD
jgi:predicted AlkP superfamily pyrophosphatase or phosphodiesterase